MKNQVLTTDVQNHQHLRAVEDYQTEMISSPYGSIETRVYPVDQPQAGVILIGGVGGGFDSPAAGLYPKLAKSLNRSQVAAVRLKYRNSTDIDESIFDLSRTIEQMVEVGIKKIGVAGYSFGGAVAIAAGAVYAEVKSIVTLATQSYGGDAVSQLGSRSLLLIHGKKDEVLPPICSIHLYEAAQAKKKLELIEGGSHALNESPEKIFEMVHQWFLETLLGA